MIAVVHVVPLYSVNVTPGKGLPVSLSVLFTVIAFFGTFFLVMVESSVGVTHVLSKKYLLASGTFVSFTL